MPKFSAKIVDNASIEKSSNTIRLMCLSDTHGIHNDISKNTIFPADILLFAGDMTLFGNPEHAESFKIFISSLPVRHKVIISGNLDLPFDLKNYSHFAEWFHKFSYKNGPEAIKTIFTEDKDIIYLEHQAITIENIKIFGSPFTPAFGDFGFPTTKESASKLWEEVPEDTDVILCHGPPHNICDMTSTGFHAGCPSLRNAVERVKPAAVVFGHIHEAHGNTIINNTLCCNVAIVNSNRDVAYGPTYIDLTPL